MELCLQDIGYLNLEIQKQLVLELQGQNNLL